MLQKAVVHELAEHRDAVEQLVIDGINVAHAEVVEHVVIVAGQVVATWQVVVVAAGQVVIGINVAHAEVVEHVVVFAARQVVVTVGHDVLAVEQVVANVVVVEQVVVAQVAEGHVRVVVVQAVCG